MVPRSTVLTSVAARMMDAFRPPGAPPAGRPPWPPAPGASDLVTAAAAAEGVPSSASFERAPATRTMIASPVAGCVRGDRGKSVVTKDTTDDEQLNDLPAAVWAAPGRARARQPRCTGR